MERNAHGDRENPTDDIRPPAYQRVEEPVPSSPQAENLNMKAEIHIPYVNPASAHVPLLTPPDAQKADKQGAFVRAPSLFRAV